MYAKRPAGSGNAIVEPEVLPTVPFSVTDQFVPAGNPDSANVTVPPDAFAKSRIETVPPPRLLT